MIVIKRDGRKVDFDKSKIIVAISKAQHSLLKDNEKIANAIAEEITQEALMLQEIDIKRIEKMVFDLLVKHKQKDVARAYEGYRAVREYRRITNTSDKDILELIEGSNKETINENSNKDAYIIPTQRDLMAGEISKDIARRKLIPIDIMEAHDKGVLHLHDIDYQLQPMNNCGLPDFKDMLANGTVINKKKIESPKSFQVACTVLSQLFAVVASSQYGGQTANHIEEILAPYLRKSKQKYEKMFQNEENKEALVDLMVKKELKDGIQTLQYQINTLMTCNGQSPFLTLFMHFMPGSEYEEECAMITEEILRQRIEGMKGPDGVTISPTFPKLVYALDEHNAKPGSKYYYLTKLAAECTAKRMMPDYVSAKIMRQVKDGQVFGPMGCRSFLSVWYDKENNPIIDGRFNKGVVTLNLPQCAIVANKDINKFWKLLDERLELCHKALKFKTERLLGVKASVAPTLWMYGAYARKDANDILDDLMVGGYSTLSLGYIGLYETIKLLTGESNTKHQDLALKITRYMADKCEEWNNQENYGYSLYSTPAESLCYRFAKLDKQQFGEIKDVTDKGYYTNSHHK